MQFLTIGYDLQQCDATAAYEFRAFAAGIATLLAEIHSTIDADVVDEGWALATAGFLALEARVGQVGSKVAQQDGSIAEQLVLLAEGGLLLALTQSVRGFLALTLSAAGCSVEKHFSCFLCGVRRVDYWRW